MPFEPQVPKSHAGRLHEAKVLENVQRLKNIQDVDRKMNESCQKCKNELVACVCMEVDYER